MLWVHCLQLLYHRSDPRLEDELNEMESLQRFAGMRLREGTVVDSTLIAASTSTQDEQRDRDPEKHQTREGNN